MLKTRIGLPFRRVWWAWCGISMVIVLIVLGRCNAALWNNIGWLYLNRGAYGPSSLAAVPYFARALRIDDSSEGAYLGAGLAYAAAEDEDSAVRAWRKGDIDASTLVEFGKKIETTGLYDVALILFRAAAQLDTDSTGLIRFSVGELCQSTLAADGLLSPPNQRYCKDYFSADYDNLLLDGQASYEPKGIWRGTRKFELRTLAAAYQDMMIGMPAPSIAISGFGPGSHGGIYQRISLVPGAEVLFSGYFRVDNDEQFSARLLYIEWQQDSRTYGSEYYTADGDLDWRHLEWHFTLPEGADSWAQFYPALASGVGTVWFDDIRVELVSSPPALRTTDPGTE